MCRMFHQYAAGYNLILLLQTLVLSTFKLIAAPIHVLRLYTITFHTLALTLNSDVQGYGLTVGFHHN